MTVIFMFPGQSSRYPKMLDRLCALSEENRDILEAASALLGRDLGAHYAAEDGGFRTNRDVQVGVFLANHLHAATLASAGITADLSLGLSLGEYNHLVDIGALPFDEALRLVDARGRCYDAGPKGMMAAVAPIDLDTLRGVLDTIGGRGTVEVANLNSPVQHVIAGHDEAVEAALAILEDEHYVQGVVIERQAPMHTSVFAPVGTAFRPYLAATNWRTPVRHYVPNVLGRPVERPDAGLFIDLLERHVHQPVLWRQSLETLAAAHPDAVLVEVGPRAVLYNLLGRRWLSNRKFRTDDPDDVSGHLDATVRALHALR